MPMTLREPPTLGAPTAHRGGDGETWPPGGGRVSTHLGWLAREPWPASPPVTSQALGAAVSRASRLRLSILQAEAPWSVRDAGVTIAEGLRGLGLEFAPPDAEDVETRGSLRFTVCTPDAIPRVADTLAETAPGCLVVAGVAREEELAQGMPRLRRLHSVACTDPALVSLLQAAGVPALLWAPVDGEGAPAAAALDDPLIAGLPRPARERAQSAEPWAERPLDIVSIGPEGGARADLLGAEAAALARRACVLVHRRALWRLEGEPLLAAPTARHLFRRAKIVLNVQSGEASALDWSQGVLDAMALGAVAVSTPCFPHPFLRKDVHYLEETPDRMLPLIDWLLDTREGQRVADTVRGAAAGVLALEASPVTAAARLLQHALSASAQAPL